MDLCWTIETSDGAGRIRVEMVMLELEPSPGCQKDSLNIYDGIIFILVSKNTYVNKYVCFVIEHIV